MIIPGGIPALSSPLAEVTPATSAPSSGASFSSLFQAAIGGVDRLQSTADTKIGSLLQGSTNADVGNVMVSVEKADVAFQLMMQVRNKVISAYQDIEKMQF